LWGRGLAAVRTEGLLVNVLLAKLWKVVIGVILVSFVEVFYLGVEVLYLKI
jgi:hypothetical protein